MAYENAVKAVQAAESEMDALKSAIAKAHGQQTVLQSTLMHDI